MLRLDARSRERGDVGLKKVGQELIVTVGREKRTIILPSALARRRPTGARLEGGTLKVSFEDGRARQSPAATRSASRWRSDRARRATPQRAMASEPPAHDLERSARVVPDLPDGRGRGARRATAGAARPVAQAVRARGARSTAAGALEVDRSYPRARRARSDARAPRAERDCGRRARLPDRIARSRPPRDRLADACATSRARTAYRHSLPWWRGSLPELRHREPGAGSVLHVLRRRARRRRCPTCGTENPPAAKFCIECGTRSGPDGVAPRRATPPPAAPGTAAARPPAPRAVRRPDPGVAARLGPGAGAAGGAPQGTVLFADLSGYTAIAERMDPEAVKSLVDRALRRLGQEVVRYGGTRRQVHRRQRDGRLRGPGRPRGRPRARRARRAGDAGGDGGDQRGHRRPRPTSASRCGSGSTPARCWPARSATATR